ncbi:MAG: hypothetical protein F7C07_02540 [Desulfurococcales archaeon]|nr:hypothetical protein [Desulfurococcales archaeon]
MAKIRIAIDLYSLALLIASTGVKYITAKDLSALLGVSTRTAGKIMAKMERMGLIKRYSNQTYMVTHNLHINSARSDHKP